MPSILIADDHTLVREGLRRILAGEADMQVVGEAASFPELLALVDACMADLVVTDVNMPGGAGAAEALKNIHARRPRLPVVVVSMMPEWHVLDLLIAGAAAYVSKEAAAAELVVAIRKVLGGYRYASQALLQRPARGPAVEGLSPRELEVLCLIALGFTVKEIAARLALSISTVHTHRARLLQKLRLRSNIELSRYAVQRGLVEWK